jgi:hypothetical protein
VNCWSHRPKVGPEVGRLPLRVADGAAASLPCPFGGHLVAAAGQLVPAAGAGRDPIAGDQVQVGGVVVVVEVVVVGFACIVGTSLSGAGPGRSDHRAGALPGGPGSTSPSGSANPPA